MEETILSPETRVFERMPCKFDLQVKNEKSVSVDKGVAFDFSGNGFGFSTNMALSLSDKVELEIFYAKGRDPMRQAGEVIRSEKMESGGWKIGVEFSSYAITKFIPLIAAINKGSHLDS